MAAAFDADWMLPGEVHQQAITQIERMVVVTNHHDPAMKFFKLSAKIGSTDALGLKGIPQVNKLGTAAKRVQHIDVTRGPLDKMFGTASLVVHTAGTHNSIVILPGLAPEKASDIRDEIRRHIRSDFE